MSRRYPDQPVRNDFPRPPRRVTDGDRRRIKIEAVESDELDAVLEELVEMYLEFDAEDRAQGIPPSGERNIRKWLTVVMVDPAINVIGRHRRDPIGHTMFVEDTDGSYEVAIFVAKSYRGAGVGTELMRTALGAAQEASISRVWLSVERWNTPAIKLYEKLGFEPVDDGGFELEMTIRLNSSN